MCGYKLRWRFVLLMAGVLYGGPYALADGFGWYAVLFDYQKFSAEYEQKLKKKISAIDRESYSERIISGRETDWAVIEILDKYNKDYRYSPPNSFSGELLWHEAMMDTVDIVLRHRPKSAIQHLLTGRVFVSAENIRRCKSEGYSLIHGACRTCVIFTDKEARTVYWDMTHALRLTNKFRDVDREEEFHRLRNIFKEAALKDSGLYIYGHD